MGRIISSFFISLDGVVESPDSWHSDYFNDEMGEIIGAGMHANKALLMGRELYDEWSQNWSNSTDDLADLFNDMPKYVVSTSLERPSWHNTTVVPGDVAAVQRLKDRIDGNIQITGSATTVRWLLAHDLLDELQLLIHPVVVGGNRQRLLAKIRRRTPSPWRTPRSSRPASPSTSNTLPRRPEPSRRVDGLTGHTSHETLTGARRSG